MESKRNIYLAMKTVEEARLIVAENFPIPKRFAMEKVAVPDAVGRVLAEPVHARISSPNFHAAAMDGYAVPAEKTFGAGETRPIELSIGADVLEVNTGHVMPEGMDAVIMIEHVQKKGQESVIIEAPVFPWQNVRKMGEDIVATELMFSRGHAITPYCIGALLSGGILTIPVRKRPGVLVMPTGSELVELNNLEIEKLKPGQVIESNSHVLGKMVESCGGECIRHELISDDIEAIKTAVMKAVDSDVDIILIGGGSSAGSEDYSRHVIADLGRILVHGVTIMPGKPIIIGTIKNKPVFGIPGYAVSAIIAFEQFVQPVIMCL
jgi:molybdopterin molybdotransferase/putative molybdopterin biosynthesis protein